MPSTPTPIIPAIALTYAAFLMFMLVGLSANVIRNRIRARAAIGDKNDPALARAVRAQANFSEYVPLAIIGLMGVEWCGAPHGLVHALGLMLLLGRISHAYSLTTKELQQPEKPVLLFRQAGMIMTFTPLVVCGVYLIIYI